MLSRIIVYPIKGCQGVERKAARLDPAGGLEYDRWFCVVDQAGARFSAGEFLNQRKFPELATISVRLNGDSMVLTDAENRQAPLEVSLQEDAFDANDTIKVECGGASTTASGGWSLGYIDGKSCGEEAAQWLTQHFAHYPNAQSKNGEDAPPTPTRFELVRCPQGLARPVAGFSGPLQKPFDASIAAQRAGVASPFRFHRLPVKASDRVRFQDAMPLLVVSENSFTDLQHKMGVDHFPLLNFRPNLVVTGFAPWDEWKWNTVKIGSKARGGPTTLRLLKPCPRCTVPGRNQKTGAWQLPKQKLLAQKTLGKMFPQFLVDDEWGEQWQGASFGRHAAHDGGDGAELRVGDAVEAEVGLSSRVLQLLMLTLIWYIENWHIVLLFLGLVWIVFFPAEFRTSFPTTGPLAETVGVE